MCGFTALVFWSLICFLGGGGAFPPAPLNCRLNLLAAQVLEEQAFALQAGRTEALEASGIVSPGAQDRGSTGAATGAGAGASSLEGVQEEEGFEEEEEEGEEDYLHDGDEDLEDMEDAEGEWQE